MKRSRVMMACLTGLCGLGCTTLPESLSTSLQTPPTFELDPSLASYEDAGHVGGDGEASLDASGRHLGDDGVGPMEETGRGYDCEPLDERPCFTPCGGAGVQVCMKTWQVCVAVEVCDGDDEDCDGAIDEGVTNDCGGCGALPPEVCNGLDDDCDAMIDEAQAIICPDSGVCLEGQCSPPGCDDGQMNAAETDVDCGGACPPCGGGQGCEVDADCQSLACEPDGLCAEPMYTWVSGDFGACSATCGEGLTHREVWCERSDGVQVSNMYCDDEMPELTSLCVNDTACDWATGPWSVCSTSCGEGMMTRELLCHGPDGVVDESLCAGIASPPSEAACTSQGGCVWVAEAWTSCSNGCGHGQKTRTLRCTGPDGEVDASLCLDPMPAALESCVAHTTCVWVSESWGDCSTSCGEGTKTREVRCQDGSGQDVSADWCPGEAPSHTSSCLSTGGCHWSATAWSSCSTDCGHGQRTRGVSCTGAAGEVDTSFCLEPKPEGTEACVDDSACAWVVESWGECSTDCGQGVQQRSFSCQGAGGVVADSLCHGQPPAAQQVCTASSSCQWSVGAWGTCSSACGGGEQSRSATCVSPSGGAVSESLCGAKPSTSQVCQTQPCEVLRTSWGGGICWSGGACGGGFGDPEGCPAGYSETGFGQGCGNPIAHSSSSTCSAAAVGSTTWTLCRFMDVHGWGCPGNYPNMGVSVRRCTWQP